MKPKTPERKSVCDTAEIKIHWLLFLLFSALFPSFRVEICPPFVPESQIQPPMRMAHCSHGKRGAVLIPPFRRCFVGAGKGGVEVQEEGSRVLYYFF